MRISDWSSDVCSSDLAGPRTMIESVTGGSHGTVDIGLVRLRYCQEDLFGGGIYDVDLGRGRGRYTLDTDEEFIGMIDAFDNGHPISPNIARLKAQIGSASCRDRVCQYV